MMTRTSLPSSARSSATAFRAFARNWLEAMAPGHNIMMLDALSFEVNVDGYETEKFIGSRGARDVVP